MVLKKITLSRHSKYFPVNKVIVRSMHKFFAACRAGYGNFKRVMKATPESVASQQAAASSLMALAKENRKARLKQVLENSPTNLDEKALDKIIEEVNSPVNEAIAVITKHFPNVNAFDYIATSPDKPTASSANSGDSKFDGIDVMHKSSSTTVNATKIYDRAVGQGKPPTTTESGNLDDIS